MRTHKILFGLIIVLALVLRIVLLTQTPPGVNRDEASIGVTAYSILKTGRDEYGKYLPLSFQSFGDWKLPLYIYTTVPFVALFGLSELAVRMPSATAGVLTVIVTYFFVFELFGSRRLSLLACVLLAISPWHLHLSRVESESNVAVFFSTLGLFLILKYLSTKRFLVIIGFILLSLTYYTYHGNHISTTLLVLGLVGIYWKSLRNQKSFRVGFIVFVVLTGFILSKTLAQADQTKIAGIGILGDPFVVHERIELPRSAHSDGGIVAKLFHNRASYAIETTLGNYAKAFSPEFLFIRGGTNRAHNIPNFGNMYLLEAPFLLLGLLVCLLNRKKPPYLLLLWWIAISPVAASITKDAPHTNRMFAIFPALPIVVALGIDYFFVEIIPKRFKSIAIGTLVFLFLINFSVYLDRYYVHFPRVEAAAWGIGYKQVQLFISQPDQQEKKVIMAHPEESPYIFLLFYSHYDPTTYQSTAQRYEETSDGFRHVKSFGRYEFRSIDWDRDSVSPNTLLIDHMSQIPDQYKARATEVGQFGIVASVL